MLGMWGFYPHLCGNLKKKFMKKFLFPVVAFVVLLSAVSCSKERKLNKNLDGTWTLDNSSKTTMGLPATAIFEYTFTKKNVDGGAFENYLKFDLFGFPVDTTIAGTYTLIEDEKIVFTYSGSTEKDTTNITAYSSTNMTWSVQGDSTSISISMTKK